MRHAKKAAGFGQLLSVSAAVALMGIVGMVGYHDWKIVRTRQILLETQPRHAGDVASEDWFEDVAAATGLNFVHDCGASGGWYFPEIMGAGCGLLDYDGDGDLDVFLVQSGPIGGAAADAARNSLRIAAASSPGSSSPSGSRLFRNDLDPADPVHRLRFTDVTDGSGIERGGYGMGVAAGDFDNDGRVDLFLTNFGRSRLYRNLGGGAFEDVTDASGIVAEGWASSAAFADVDADGRLDLFVCFYVDYSLAADVPCTTAAGQRDYCGPRNYPAAQSRLYRNVGEGRFVDVTAAAGMAGARRHGLGVACGDLNGDGRMDIFVANDGDGNQLWSSNGDGTFTDIGLISGAAVNETGMAEAGMGVGLGDYDADGNADIFITHLAEEHHTLYAAAAPGLFQDVTAAAGLAAPGRSMTGFGTEWFDYDHDGRLDLFLTNGAVLVQSEQSSPRPFVEYDQLFRNVGSRFEETSQRAGRAFLTPGVGRGAAFGDIDNDGDVDILTTCNHGPARLLLNRVGTASAPWLRFRLTGTRSNRDALGARMTLEGAAAPPLMRWVHRDGSYLSANDARVHFGLGSMKQPRRVLVEWPLGSRESWPVDQINVELHLVEGSGRAEVRR